MINSFKWLFFLNSIQDICTIPQDADTSELILSIIVDKKTSFASI